MIKLLMIGHLGRDCQLKEVNGKSVMSFTVAHTEKFKDSQGNQKEKTTWVDCSYWSDRTGISPYLTKGKQVYVEGFPEADTYVNKEGQHVSVLRMRVLNVQLLSSGSSDSSNQGASNSESNSNGQLTEATQESGSQADDLPF